MKGLILKDLLNLRKQSKIILAMFAFYLVMAVAGGNETMFGFIVTLMTVMLTITSMAFDERSNWDKYALTMPISRKELVLGKYLLGIILAGLAFLINFIFLAVARPGFLAETALTALGMLGISILFLAVVLPLLLKFGVERGRLVMMMALFLPTGIIMLLSRAGLKPPSLETMEFLPYAAGVFVILAFAASALASLKIISSKEM